MNIYVNPNFPIHLSHLFLLGIDPYVCSVCLCLYFCFANKIIYTISFSFYIYALVYNIYFLFLTYFSLYDSLYTLRHIHSNVHCSTIYNNQDIEAT